MYQKEASSMTLAVAGRTSANDEIAASSVAEQLDEWVVLGKRRSAESCDGEAAVPPPCLLLGARAADDTSRHTPILTPPLMEALRPSLPFSLSEDNFWLRYSLFRDGSSLVSLLRSVRGLQYTVIAVETVGGEVFGSFTSMPWRRERGFYGNGQSFLWRMRESRPTFRAPSNERAAPECDVEVFEWRGADELIQICTGDRMGVGGGGARGAGSGFGFVIEDDLLRGSSGRCETFGSPCLCPRTSDCGGVFEIANLEVYTLTPFMFEEDAERNELMKLFLEENRLSLP